MRSYRPLSRKPGPRLTRPTRSRATAPRVAGQAFGPGVHAQDRVADLQERPSLSPIENARSGYFAASACAGGAFASAPSADKPVAPATANSSNRSVYSWSLSGFFGAAPPTSDTPSLSSLSYSDFSEIFSVCASRAPRAICATYTSP